MIKFLTAAIVALLTSNVCCGCNSNPIATNEEPMYGNMPFSDEQKKLNYLVVNEVIKEAGSKQAALKRTIKLAWYYFYNRNDRAAAMRRFNQAWLLDPNSNEVFYGFGVLTSLQGKTGEAIPLYKKALELNPHDPMAAANLARCYKDKAYELYRKNRQPEPNQAVKAILSRSFPLYEQASKTATSASDIRLTTLAGDLSYIYYQWAVALEFNSQYAKAWEKVKLSRKYGGDRIIEPGFLHELSRLMPEPKN